MKLERAVQAFVEQCADLEQSTRRKYKNTLKQLGNFAKIEDIDTVTELTTEALDEFRDALIYRSVA